MFQFNFIKNIIYNLKSTKEQKDLLKNSKVGDMVWAKMPLPKKQLSQIEESHRKRPYLIVYKDSANIYAYQSSSKNSSKLNNYEEYLIKKLRYKKNRDSWISLVKVHKVPVCNLVSSYISLNEFDLRNIEKRLMILKNRYKDVILFNVNIFISVGDVVLIDKCRLYFVYAVDNVSIYCARIYKKVPLSKKKYYKIIINKSKFYVCFEDLAVFKRNVDMKIINIAYEDEVESFLTLKKKSKEDNTARFTKTNTTKKSKIAYESGTIFKIGLDKIVYLFEIDNKYYGVDLLMYQIYPKVINIHNIESMQIEKILEKHELIKIVENLHLKNVQPYRSISNLYDELREVNYGY